jgi:hypothetical protein
VRRRVSSIRTYRLYRLDEWSRIRFSEDIAAEDDAEAIRLAGETRPNANKCEIWEARRLVATFDGERWELDPV